MTSLLSRCMLFQPLGVDQCPFRDTCSHRLENCAPCLGYCSSRCYCWRRWGFVTGNLPQKNKSERKGNVRRRDKEGVFGPQLHGKNNTLRRRRFGDRTIARPLLGEECLQLPCRRPVLNQRTLPTGSPDPSRVAGGRCKTCCCCVGSRQDLPPTAGGRARSLVPD